MHRFVSPSASQITRLREEPDIMISSEEVEVTLECLFALGYRVFFQSPKGAAKWFIDLERHGDVGMIDLHQGLPGHNYFFRSLGSIRQYGGLIATQLGTAYVPFSTYQALILIVHDQFQDYDYWTGNIDLRHLLDLRDLAGSAEGVDWKLLASLSPSELYRNALETQLLALHSLFNVDVPVELRRRFMPRLQFNRRLIQARMPFLTRVFLATALLDYRNYRAEVGAEERRAKTSKPQRWAFPKMDTLRFLLDLSAKKRPGKV